MRIVIRILLIILALATGGLFLYSAYTKTIPIQTFEYTMVEYLHLSWLMAAVGARFFVGLEAGIGSLIALHLFGGKKWVLKLAFALLVFFSAYLIFLWIKVGNNVNCGCFGDAIWMNASTSLIKNAVLLIVTGILLKFHHGWPYKWARVVAPVILIIVIALPFILFPLPSRQPDWLRKDKYQIDLSALYAPGKTDKPTIDLTKGKYILAFFSPTCPHCQMAAFKMHLMKRNDPSLPFFAVIGGTHDLKDFWKRSQAQDDLPYTRLGVRPFIHYTGGIFPTILWINNDTVVAKTNYIIMNQAEIEKWLKE